MRICSSEPRAQRDPWQKAKAQKRTLRGERLRAQSPVKGRVAPQTSLRSNPDIIFGGAFATLMAGIWHAARLNQQQFDLVFCVWLVFDSFRDDQHLARRHIYGTITKIDP